LATLTKDQKAIKQRIKASIEKEIGMCDDHADLMVLATTLYKSSKLIFSTYPGHEENPISSEGSEKKD